MCVINFQVNHNFPGSSTPSISTPLSAELNHRIEPPSNQRSCHKNTCIWPEEDKAS